MSYTLVLTSFASSDGTNPRVIRRRKRHGNLAGLGVILKQVRTITFMCASASGRSANQYGTANVYWSPPATLVTPIFGHSSGPNTIPIVPSGNVLTVSNAITWQGKQYSLAGHYCFVALIGTANGPRPLPAVFRTGTTTCSSSKTTIMLLGGISMWLTSIPRIKGPITLPFLAPGAPDIARPMRLEVVSRFATGDRESGLSAGGTY